MWPSRMPLADWKAAGSTPCTACRLSGTRLSSAPVACPAVLKGTAQEQLVYVTGLQTFRTTHQRCRWAVRAGRLCTDPQHQMYSPALIQQHSRQQTAACRGLSLEAILHPGWLHIGSAAPGLRCKEAGRSRAAPHLHVDLKQQHVLLHQGVHALPGGHDLLQGALIVDVAACRGLPQPASCLSLRHTSTCCCTRAPSLSMVLRAGAAPYKYGHIMLHQRVHMLPSGQHHLSGASWRSLPAPFA